MSTVVSACRVSTDLPALFHRTFHDSESKQNFRGFRTEILHFLIKRTTFVSIVYVFNMLMDSGHSYYLHLANWLTQLTLVKFQDIIIFFQDFLVPWLFGGLGIYTFKFQDFSDCSVQTLLLSGSCIEFEHLLLCVPLSGQQLTWCHFFFVLTVL